MYEFGGLKYYWLSSPVINKVARASAGFLGGIRNSLPVQWGKGDVTRKSTTSIIVWFKGFYNAFKYCRQKTWPEFKLKRIKS